MSSEDDDITIEESEEEVSDGEPIATTTTTTTAKKSTNTKGSNKRLSVERIYQKKSQLEHILLRPDTYVGSVEKETKQMWVYDEGVGMQLRDISYVPGLYKIFDEVLVNAADNKQRDKTMSCIRIDINPDKNEIIIFNNGKGIPVIEHKDEKMFVPTMIFGHLLTSSNYDDNQKKVVGGRNGYGAKLCNIFSTRFKVETSCKEYKKAFTQVWTDNMKAATEPKISASVGEDYTRVTFCPDLKRFGMDALDKDIVALFSRRAYDCAGSSKGIKVFLNGQRLPINGFKAYCELFVKDKEDENGEPLKLAHEVVNERWEVAATVSDKGFQQVSFVNSIATTRGGKHVDYIADQIVAKMVDIIKKKNKAGVNIKPFQIKNHLWLFVNCLIENPSFDSQTKETMTLQSKSFGSKCAPTEKFFAAVNKIGAVESVMSWVRFKAQTELSKQCNAKKQSKLKGIPKLEDANDAGTKHSIDCTLILTEGDSAKSLVVAGLGVIGRDKYGVFPLRGKLLNVREATHKQILENAEINNLIKILGLQYKKQYSSVDDLRTLRYGKLMIMTDQDQDGSHIKGLLINFIHHNWPKLLELNFLEEFITPIVKVTKGSNIKSFYSLPEFEEWKGVTANWSAWRVKYYKGLGTSTSNEAKEYFTDMRRHRITFKYSGADDDHAVMLAFSKKMVEQRKDWLTNNLEERKNRREMGLPEVYLYESNTRSISYKDFVNKELILFSNMDNERSIPSLMDGLKPGQRKVMFTCFKRNDKREVKVAQLAGSVGEHSAYHHGEASLMSTIIGLAQNFVGSNNINLLQPIGQFGTRLQGGKDAASPRYIFTMLSPLARKIFPALDDPLLNSLYDDNVKIEPEYYAPILPMVLVNGAEGIGTGWSTKIPNYNPRDIVENLRRMIRGEPPERMQPWYKGFRGSIVQIDTQRHVMNGEVGLLDGQSFEITELPVRTWTQNYKESTLELLLHGNEKTAPFINEYKEYHTESTVRFVVGLTDANLKKSLDSGIHKTFKLQTSMSTTSMVLFDHNGCLKRYETPEEIIREYFPVRLEFYVKRKAYYEGKLEAEALKLENQAKFILEKNDGLIRMENVKKKDFVQQLIDRRYDSDPVKAWVKKNGLTAADGHQDRADGDRSADEASDTEETVPEATAAEADKKYDFDYLFDMSMRSMLRERVEQLLKQRDDKKAELEALKRKTPEMLWESDLKEFAEELDSVEEQERQAGAKALKPKAAAQKLASKQLKTKKVNLNQSLESKPSDVAERVEPKIDVESYKKPEKGVKRQAKDAKEGSKATKKKPKTGDENSPGGGDDQPVVDIDSDSDADVKPLAERMADKKKAKPTLPSVKGWLMSSPPDPSTAPKAAAAAPKAEPKKATKTKPEKSEPIEKKAPKKKENKKTTTTAKAASKKGKNPWSDSESDDDDNDYTIDDDDSDSDDRIVPLKTNTRVVNKQIDSESDTEKETSVVEVDDLVSFNATKELEEPEAKKPKKKESEAVPKKKKETENKKSEALPKKRAEAVAKKPAPKRAAAAKATKKKNVWSSDSEDDDDDEDFTMDTTEDIEV
ncbi:unnamed protein product [Oppiella nova]|uniref:DNA topoisomerase 2 n=1 Tax=Oppiella nova TaxID=334625 RepID=A0A7R9LLM6_9ACAR|nr:unnamed protein product [Oppiella nova]CAG2164860.1 unnamed protein product [Oppiella nova]